MSWDGMVIDGLSISCATTNDQITNGGRSSRTRRTVVRDTSNRDVGVPEHI